MFIKFATQDAVDSTKILWVRRAGSKTLIKFYADELLEIPSNEKEHNDFLEALLRIE